MTIAEQYNQAIHNWDTQTIAQINKMLPDAQVKRVEFLLYICMGKYNQSVLSNLKVMLTVLFSACASKIEYILTEPLEMKMYNMEVQVKVPIAAKRTVKELKNNEIVGMFKLPYCGITNIKFFLEDNSELLMRGALSHSERKWKQFIDQYNREML